MKRILAALLVVFLLVGSCAFAETAQDLIPDTSLWGVSRTKFRNQFGTSFGEIEANGYKCLVETGLTVDGYPMDAYYEFASSEMGYSGLSRVLYLVSLSGKASDSELSACYSALYRDMKGAAGEPDTSGKTDAAWYYDDCTVEMNIGRYRAFNGTNNKTVAVVFSKPDGKQQPAADDGKSGNMTVTATASCSDYNHVGYNWTQSFYINGKKIRETSQIDLKAGDEITARAVISENDSTPDAAVNEKTYTVTKSDLTNGFTISFTVMVSENNGRYAGYKARWNVRFRFE
ncbi:MAG: hypothetical protein IKE30_01735 [Clostridia bacterium]|nr:hypothetical protein [Clostridia bacterium]